MKSFLYKDLRFCILLLLFISSTNVSFGQKYKYITAEKNMENWNHSLNDNGSGTLLDLNYKNLKKRHYSATTCDDDLKNFKSNDISFLENKTYQFAYFRRNKLYLFATDKDKALYKFQVNPESFSIIGSPETIFSINDDAVEYRTAYSEDSTYFSILCLHYNKKANVSNFTGIIFDVNFSIVNKYQFIPTVPISEMNAINFIISSKGTAAVICQGRTKVKKKKELGELYYSITTVSGKGEPQSKVAAGKPSEVLQNINWYFDKDNIAFNGIVGASFKNGFTGVVTGTYNILAGTLENIKESAFSSLSSNRKAGLPSTQEIIDNGISANASLKQVFNLADNSCLLIYDVRTSASSGSSTDMTTGHYNPTSLTTYFSKETYVIKLNENKEIEWCHAIMKKQSEVASQLYMGIVCFLDNSEGLHIFFHDKSDNTEVYERKIKETTMLNIKKNSVACVFIKPSGNIRKSFVWDNADLKTYMAPEYSITNKKSEVTFISVQKSKDGYFTIGKIKMVEK